MPQPPLARGQHVAAKPGKLAGVDPFDRLFVKALNDDGTVLVASVANPMIVWKHVYVRHLIPIEGDRTP